MKPWIVGVSLVCVIGGCSDYELKGRTDPGDPNDTDLTDPTDTDASVDEVCNGEDDDGDGLVDEGFPDTDGDGLVDCLDEDCAAELPGDGTVTIDETCVSPDVIVPDPWNVKIEWQWTGLAANPAIHNVIMTPVIGSLNDDDGDGDADEDDVPDIVFVAYASSSIQPGTLVALDGVTHAELFAQAGYHGGGGIALADVDNDGRTDILGFDNTGRPVAVDGAGVRKWTSTVTVGTSYPQATVADVDGDGNPEVIADTYVLDGRTGATEANLYSPTNASIPYRLPAVGDLDLDGIQEVVIGNTVFDPTTGAVKWSAGVTGGYGHWSAIVDADGDLEAEVAMVGAGRLAIFQANGSVIVNVAAGTGQPGAPCVADFDGDGAAEIGWASSSLLNVYNLDGTLEWTAPVTDASGLASCSGYDIDGDGAYELLFADEETLFIFDGATGAVNYSMGGHASVTLWEYPAVADIDKDGSAEIVMASNNGYYAGWGGITVFGHAGSGWLEAGPTWHTHDFAVTNILEDGSVPAVPDPWWQIHNVYRARPAVDSAATDLQVAFADVCFAGCEDASEVEVAVVVSNHGGTDVGDGIAVVLYANDGGALTPIASQTLTAAVASGTSVGLLFEVTLGQAGADGFTVSVDDDGTGLGAAAECDESNNRADYTDRPC